MVTKAVYVAKWLDGPNKPSADRWAVSFTPKDENTGQSRHRVTLHHGGVVLK
jgi:hypothetical protein